ncbi:MAG: peptide ABC transporter substrate-binding protein [Chloroflexi bacterium]|nr:peptide ABC transporter substrate-binding protein [Chloroflexota bacterium]
MRPTSTHMAGGAALVALSVVLAACGGGQSPSPSASGGGASAAESPVAGGTVTIGLFQEPDNLNPYTAIQTASRVVREFTLEGLLGVDPDGNYVPELAAEVPSVANGGISADGKTITYKLKSGVTWSDGDPFTSADVKFTWQAIMDPANKVNTRSGYEQITSIDTPDPLTVVLNLKALYSPALQLFSSKGQTSDAVLPEHVLKGQVMANAEFSRKPEGTGPFVVDNWVSGDSITLSRNPNFRVAGQPILDQIIIKILADQQAGIAQMQAGAIDVLWNLDEASVSSLANAAGVDISSTPSSNIEYLGLNLSKRGTADPSVPHPILGDASVRKALSLAIDRSPILNDLLGGRTEAATSPIGLGWATPQGLSLPDPDPEAAKALLETAGWKDSDGDGIREKGGVKLSLEISTPSGQALRDQTEQILQAQFKAIGVDLVINNVTAAVLFGSWDENGKLKRGDFDIVEDTWGADLDPADWLATLFTSDQIPTAANAGAGWNFFRLQDPALDAAVAAGAATLDQEARKAAYRTAVERILADLVYIPLYKRAELDAFATSVQGEKPNPWEPFTWTAAQWSVSD